jgi:O-antigen/teichoic acid export membrane protein
MGSVRRSLLFSLADNYLGMLLQLAASLIIARLLTPTEIGIYSVAAVLSALASTFRDFGVAEYLIQEKNLTQEKIRAAFAANLGVSWLMGLLLLGSSGAVGEFYRQPGVAEVMRIQCMNFLLIPFGAVTMAYFRRELNYRPIFIAGLCANISSFSVATLAALSGLGYLSLAWSSLTGVAVTVTVSIFFRPKDFPRWPGLAGLGEVIRFGKHASGIYLFGQIGKNAPEAIIGRVLDMASVAFFSRANGLMELFNRTVLRAVTPVCLPYFSQAARAGEPTRDGYLKAIGMLTGIGWPFFLYIGVAAYSIIRLLYGPQWMTSVPLAQILCLVAILELPYYLGTEVLIAEGRIDQSNRLQFLIQAMRVSSLFLVIPFGLPGACWGLVVSASIGAAIGQRFLHEIIGLRFLNLVRACTPSALVAVISITPIALLSLVVEQSETNYLPFFLGGSLATGITWLAGLRVFRHPFWDEISRFAGGLMRRNRGT